MTGVCGGSIDPNKDRGFPGMCLQDGPSGVRPSASTQSCKLLLIQLLLLIDK